MKEETVSGENSLNQEDMVPEENQMKEEEAGRGATRPDIQEEALPSDMRRSATSSQLVNASKASTVNKHRGFP